MQVRLQEKKNLIVIRTYQWFVEKVNRFLVLSVDRKLKVDQTSIRFFIRIHKDYIPLADISMQNLFLGIQVNDCYKFFG